MRNSPNAFTPTYKTRACAAGLRRTICRSAKEYLRGSMSAIRVRDKVLLILSEHSIRSGRVKDEVNTGFEERKEAWA